MPDAVAVRRLPPRSEATDRRPGRLPAATSLLLALAVVTLAACTHVVPPDVHTAETFSFDLPGEPALALAVWDDREDVVRGDRDPNWIGLDRTLYGIPIGRQTKSGQPFATDLAAMLERSLEGSGADVQVVPVRVGGDKKVAVDELATTGRSRLVLLRLDEWYNDQFAVGTVHHDLTLEVFAADGTSLAKTSLAGEEDIGRKKRPGRQNVSQLTAELMERMMTRPAIHAALAGEPIPEDAASGEASDDDRTCTVEQILQMRESGLSESQIKAACGEG